MKYLELKLMKRFVRSNVTGRSEEEGQKALGRHFLLDWLLKPVWSGASTRCFHYRLALLLQQVLVVGVQVRSSKPDFSGDFRETLWE